MKRFFNLSTGIMLGVIAIAVIVAVLSSTINWQAVIWMVIAAMWVAIARVNEMMSDGWKELYYSTNDELTELRKQNTDTDAKYQTAVQDLDNVTQKVEELTQALEAKKPRRKKKLDLSDEDVTRIKMEMRTAGLIKEEE